jgi:hypothetical protein
VTPVPPRRRACVEESLAPSPILPPGDYRTELRDGRDCVAISAGAGRADPVHALQV